MSVSVAWLLTLANYKKHIKVRWVGSGTDRRRYRSCMRGAAGLVRCLATARVVNMFLNKYKWTQISCADPLPKPRSSHSLNVVGGGGYVMGGEHEPRVPIGSAVWALDVTGGKWRELQTKGAEVPARNAHAAAVVGSCIYIFGGRQGIAMGEGSLADMYKLDTTTATWSEVPMAGEVPAARSYHCMTSLGTTLYVFGGCTLSGRLSDLHSFDTDTGVWRALPTSDLVQGRGGAGLAAVGRRLYVVAGFVGHEVGDVHEFDTVTSQWRPLQVTPALPPRSVCGVASLGSRIVVVGGEVSPSSQGHAGAGRYSNEVFVLDTKDEEGGWQRVEPGGCPPPAPRGWFSASAYGNDGVLLFGGNSEDNVRLNDTYLLQVAL